MKTKKNKLINFLKRGILLFGIPLLLWNCEKNEIIVQESTSIISDAKAKINFNNLDTDLYSKENVIINWNEFNLIQNEGINFYEFKIELKNQINHLPEIFKEAPLLSLVAYTENNEIKINFIEFLAYNSSNTISNSIGNLDMFSGSLRYFDQHGKLINKESYFKGVLVNSDIENFINFPKNNFSEDNNVSARAEPCGRYGKTVTVQMKTKHYTDYYNIWSGTSGTAYVDFVRTEYEGETTSYYSYYSPPCDSGTGDYLYKTHIERRAENTVVTHRIIEELTGKAKCVYDKLEVLSADFKEAIQKFDGEFPVSHLNLIMEDLGNTRGETRAPDGAGTSPDYIITIAINSNSNIHGANYRPNLMTAKTIAHEVIHAEMFRKLLSLAKQGNLDFTGWSSQQQKDYVISIKKDFPGIYDYYRRHKNWQHQQMATHYRQTIADILKDFDNNQHSNQFYLDTAWEGLIRSNIYTWTSLSQQEQDRIKKVISDYINVNKNEICQ